MARAPTEVATSILLPRLWAPLVDAEPLRLFEHAALDPRAHEAMAALALVLAEKGLAPLIVTADPPRVRRALIRVSRKLATRITIAQARPRGSFGALLVPDAHAIASDPRGGESLCRMAGVIAPRGHWYYAACRSGAPVERLDAARVRAAFPSEKPLPETDPRHGRLMMLHDVEQVSRPFLVMARERLWVRTDKGSAFMTAEQIAEAGRQLGPSWESGADGSPIVPFVLSPLQRRYLAMKRLARAKGYRRFAVLKYRRGGITTVEQALSYLMASERPHSHVATIAHTQEQTNRIFEIAKIFHERDPRRLRETGDSRTRLQLENGSQFIVGTASGAGFGRGDTLQRVHGSEAAYWMRGEQSSVESLVAGIVGAASRGEVVLESTANGEEWFAHTYREARAGRNAWWPIFLPWFADRANVAAPGTFDPAEVRDTLSDQERALVARYELTIEQIAFRRAIAREHGRLRPQEYPEDDMKLLLTSGLCYFDIGTLLDLAAALMAETPPERKHVPGGYLVEWEPPIPGEEYVIGADTSEGLPGCDPNGYGVLHKGTGRQVAEAHGYFKPPQLAALLRDATARWNRALTAVERQNHGHAVLLELANLGDGDPHTLGGTCFHFRDGRAGWSTDASTRPVMLSALSAAVEGGQMRVRDRELLAECLAFKLQSNGRFEAASGSHDDRVMKWAVAWQMREHRVIMPSITWVR